LCLSAWPPHHVCDSWWQKPIDDSRNYIASSWGVTASLRPSAPMKLCSLHPRIFVFEFNMQSALRLRLSVLPSRLFLTSPCIGDSAFEAWPSPEMFELRPPSILSVASWTRREPAVVRQSSIMKLLVALFSGVSLSAQVHASSQARVGQRVPAHV
jgi:hypothetical protein